VDGANSVFTIAYEMCIDSLSTHVCIISFRRVMEHGHDESQYRTAREI